jgi:hypothetical protein
VSTSGNGAARQHDHIAIHRVIVGAGGREAGDPVAHRNVVHPFADRHDHTGHFMADARRQACLGRRQVLAPEHVIPADADRLDAHLHSPAAGDGSACSSQRSTSAWPNLWKRIMRDIAYLACVNLYYH